MFEYFKNIWSGFTTALHGMAITSSHIFAKSVTIQYPDEKLTLPSNARNRLQLEMSRCNACNSCAVACPVNCITVEGTRVSPDDPQQDVHWDGKPRKMWVTRYEIDFAKCCFCGLCQSACPTDAIKHTVEYEYSEYDRNKLLYKFQTLSPAEAEEKKRLLAEFRAKEKEKECSSTTGKAHEAKE